MKTASKVGAYVKLICPANGSVATGSRELIRSEKAAAGGFRVRASRQAEAQISAVITVVIDTG
jgi:hypothetical protein